ncbi:MAG: redox-regulated ATPase YchF [Armatimonadetes bacterium]|nr:redox-regulated ATPase YchF [Armatimonadota bacterium]
MKVGIVGLPESGKTTLFRALTRGTVKTDLHAQAGKPNIGVVSVPDPRIDYFAAQYNPKKITYASIEFIDGAARIAQDDGRTKFGSDFFADVRQVDMLVHVVRGFTSAGGDAPSPVADVQTLNDELALADLQLVENRMQRVEKQLHGVKKGTTTPATMEMELLERLKSALEEGKPLTSLDLGTEDEKAIRSYDFLTLKQMIAVLNIPEEMIGSADDNAAQFKSYCDSAALPEIDLCAKVEMEVSELSDEEEAEFLSSMGIEEPARNRLIRECYKTLGLISFITAGEPEVRAWTLRAGSKAVEAAGTIHSDLARGFIRAEVANFTEVEAVGGWEAAKQQGIVQLQGKDYIVRDGDVMYIRFKV